MFFDQLRQQKLKIIRDLLGLVEYKLTSIQKMFKDKFVYIGVILTFTLYCGNDYSFVKPGISPQLMLTIFLITILQKTDLLNVILN